MRLLGPLIVLISLTWPGLAAALVNINTASISELDTLPYVSTTTAELIIAKRPFAAVSEIQKVSGFGGGPGSRNYDAIIGLITVTGETTVPTPDVETVTSSASRSVVATSSGKQSAKSPLPGLVIETPAYAHAGQLVTFKVRPSDGQTRPARYSWNFGDGTVGTTATETHTYLHPGRYVVVVEGYYQREFISGRVEIEVLPLALKVSATHDQVTIINDSEAEVDLFNMSLQGRGEFAFPKHSFLLPGASITIPLLGSGPVVLYDQSGRIVMSPPTVTPAPPPTPNRARVAAVAAPKPLVAATTSSARQSELLEPSEQSANGGQLAAVGAAPADVATLWPYLGLLGLIMLGIFVVFFGRRSG